MKLLNIQPSLHIELAKQAATSPVWSMFSINSDREYGRNNSRVRKELYS